MKSHLTKLPLLLGLLGLSQMASAKDYTVKLDINFAVTSIAPVAAPDAGIEFSATSDYGNEVNFTADPGSYIIRSNDYRGYDGGSLVLNLTEETDFYDVCIYTAECRQTYDSGAPYIFGTDFYLSSLYVASQNGEQRTIEPGVHLDEEHSKTYFSFMMPKGDSYSIVFTPAEKFSDKIECTLSGTITLSWDQPHYISFPTGKTFKYTVPEGGKFGMYSKRGSTHYIPFDEIAPKSVETADGKITYTYFLSPGSNVTTNWRFSAPGTITRARVVNGSELEDIDFTSYDLTEYSPRYFNHDLSANSSHNYADIYLNINKLNHIFMNPGDQSQIVNVRTWQVGNSVVDNYFIEPDYHYTVLNTDFKEDDSVLKVNENGMMEAVGDGTAIVQVRYDAFIVGENVWSEIWAENTGTFVVTVGATPNPGLKAGIMMEPRAETLDCEHDIMYYDSSVTDHYSLTFTPEGAASVSVANPVVDSKANTVAYPGGFSAENVIANADGSYTLPLTFGRNIIRFTAANGDERYQVISAKPFTHTVIKDNGRTDNYTLPGDEMIVQLNGLFHMAGKLAGIYNQSCSLVLNDLANKEQAIGGGQYDFAAGGKAQQWRTVIPADTDSDKFELNNGCLELYGYGSMPGAHRTISYKTGVNPNFSAPILKAFYGRIQNFSEPVTPYSDGLTLTAKVEVGKSITPVSLAGVAQWLGSTPVITVSDPEIATVDENGLVTGVGAGNAVVRFTDASQSKSVYCNVEVFMEFIPLTGFSFPQKSIVFNEIEKSEGSGFGVAMTFIPENATNQNVTFISSDPTIVEHTGGVRFKTYNVLGTATVTGVTEDGGFTDSFTVEIRRFVSKITLPESEVTLSVGESYTLEPTVLPEDTYDKGVTMSVDDPNIISVDENGVVTALSEGKATVTIRSVMKKSTKARCTFTVSPQSGLENIDDAAVEVSPNPFTEYLTVTSPKRVDVSVYDLLGNQVISATVDAGTSQISTSALRNGIYIVRVGSLSRKMIRK